MKVGFGVVIYKQAMYFIREFLQNMEQQTNQDFDLLIVNDDCDMDELDLLDKYLCENGLAGRFHMINGISKTGFVADYRVQLIYEAKNQGYDLLIIGDADDLFAGTRIEKVTNVYQKNRNRAFYYNYLYDNRGRILMRNIPKEVSCINDILQRNFLGMSNTALNMSCMTKEFIVSLYDGCCPVFDWYLFSRILLDIGTGILVENTYTVYRLYTDNLVGIQNAANRETVRREKEVKLAHYARLENKSPECRVLKKQLAEIEIDNCFKDSIYYSKNENGYWWAFIQLRNNG